MEENRRFYVLYESAHARAAKDGKDYVDQHKAAIDAVVEAARKSVKQKAAE